MTIHTHLDKNPNGRDFVIGDIHGDKEAFLAALDSVQFNSETDRLFSLGDLVDRGNDNLYLMDLLEQDWFFAIRGNHEQMILNCFEHPQEGQYRGPDINTLGEAQLFHQLNGGRWYWEICNHTQRNDIYHLLSGLPYAITLETASGPVGLVHAEVPEGFHQWSKFVQALSADEAVRSSAIWQREKIKNALAPENPGITANENQTRYIEGVVATVHGHTGVHKPMNYGNQIWIDTGYLAGELTILNTEELAGFTN